MKDHPWDNFYKIGKEHIDFYLNHKLNTNWKFAVTPNVIITHNPGGQPNYQQFRLGNKRLDKSDQYFYKKWKVKKIIDGRGIYLSKDNLLKKIKVRLISLNAPVEILSLYEGIYKRLRKGVNPL